MRRQANTAALAVVLCHVVLLAAFATPLGPVVINEVAWSGSSSNSTAEWIELVNISTQAVDLSGWHLVSSDQAPSVPLQGILAPLKPGDPTAGYYLLKRDSRGIASGPAADLTYSGALTDRGETLYLMDAEGRLADTANSSPSDDLHPPWAAGTGHYDVAPHCSMERVDFRLPDVPENWATSPLQGVDPDDEAPCGTPKHENWAFNLPPVPWMTIQPARPQPGEPVTFDGSASTDPNDRIVSYTWDFGDGDIGSGQTTSHVFADIGEVEITLSVEDSKGAIAELQGNLNIAAAKPPLVDFSARSTTAELTLRAGDSVIFQDESSYEVGDLARWLWHLGDGSESEGSQVVHTFEAFGTYIISLLVTDEHGAQAEQTQSLVIASLVPEARFSVSPDPPILGEPVLFDATASDDPDGDVAAYCWDFDGDGLVDVETTEPSVTHSYKATGAVSPSLYVVDTNKDRSRVFERSLAVNAAPVAQFSVSVSEPSELEAIRFVDRSYDEDGEIVDWLWNFGDGRTSVQTSPVHAFSSSGEQSIRLTVTDDAGTTQSATLTLSVANLPPTPALSAEPFILVTGASVAFDATAARDPSPGGSLVRYEWDLDGDDRFDQETTCATLSYTYVDDGSYVVTVRVTDNDGATALSAPVTVTVQNQPPRVTGATWTPLDVADGEPVAFTADAVDADGTIVAFRWDFGDAASDVSETPTYTFPDDGTHHISLVVTDDDGQASEPLVVDVPVENAPPVATFTVSGAQFDPACVLAFDARSSFDPSPTGSIPHVAWDFGDGSSCPGTPNGCGSTGRWTPVHCFVAPGTYTVTLIVIDEQGAIGRASRQITIAEQERTFDVPNPRSILLGQ